ncbi:FAD binding domain-containing protein [Paenibacillus sp. JDR-2]|uniref:FAD binding domain-containing protein n=1 Tax=Paenibacillus sp. (strain JDR-2) TaxID=324057 RepID=UPI000166BC32|nr:FAD binding domain-containing protein [Paenibacillus sp. JDR-2]ACT01955.1 molybdopterin dehydrogenase FAD-binding [Paenibacillus sp. JDR-2]
MAANAQGVAEAPFVWHPATVEEAWQLKGTLGAEGVFTAGGTLLRTQWESGLAAVPNHLINIGAIDELHGLQTGSKSGTVSFGAMITLSDIRTSPIVNASFPLLTEAARSIAAPSIRNQATIGGNVLSMVGDSIPALLIYDPVLHWHDGASGLEEPLSEWLSTAAVHPAWKERLLLSVALTQPTLDSNTKRFVAFHKVGRRDAFTPSVVTAAFSMQLDSANRLSDVRLALGGGQTIPHRLENAEQFLTGKLVDKKTITEVYSMILEHYEPKGDAFVPVSYRKKAAANLIASELWKALR